MLKPSAFILFLNLIVFSATLLGKLVSLVIRSRAFDALATTGGGSVLENKYGLER
jgi:hypothetical protein